MNYQFTCPQCGYDRHIEEIMEGAHLCSKVSSIYPEGGVGDEIETTETEWQDGALDRYQCSNCGFEIAKTTEDLISWLKEHGMLVKLKNFEVQIKGEVTKTIKVEAVDEETAIERAHELFTVNCENPNEEKYDQETINTKEV